MSVLGLANKNVDSTGSNNKIVYAPLPADDPVVRELNISKAIKHLGWSPLIKRATDLEETSKCFQGLPSLGT